MDSFDGGRRRDGEPLEQRLDRWVSTGRQLVEGVSGGRPGARQGSRRAEGRGGNRGGFDGLGRWVEDRLDWLLDDSDDWPEPWQESPGRRGAPPAVTERRLSQERESFSRPPLTRAARLEPMPETAPVRAAAGALPETQRPRRRLEAVSRRGLAARSAAAVQPGQSPQTSASEDWPDDSSFSVLRWQRPSAPLRRPDPLQAGLDRRDPLPDNGGETTAARPLPRSSRRR